jgi:hypothetical protein
MLTDRNYIVSEAERKATISEFAATFGDEPKYVIASSLIRSLCRTHHHDRDGRDPVFTHCVV